MITRLSIFSGTTKRFASKPGFRDKSLLPRPIYSNPKNRFTSFQLLLNCKILYDFLFYLADTISDLSEQFDYFFSRENSLHDFCEHLRINYVNMLKIANVELKLQ